jgi:hypothetical protein
MPYSTKTLIDNWFEELQAPVVRVERTLRPFEPQFVNRIARITSIPTEHKTDSLQGVASVYRSDYMGNNAKLTMVKKRPEFINESTIFEMLFDDRRPVDWIPPSPRPSQPQTTANKKDTVKQTAVSTDFKNRRSSSLITRGNDKRRGQHVFNDWQ